MLSLNRKRVPCICHQERILPSYFPLQRKFLPAGSGLATIIDGVPAGLKITEEYIQKELDKRKPGVGKLNSPRLETDKCAIFAGIGQDRVTTGAPLGIIIYNVDTQDVHIQQYREYKDIFRPGHAAYPFFLK